MNIELQSLLSLQRKKLWPWFVLPFVKNCLGIPLETQGISFHVHGQAKRVEQTEFIHVEHPLLCHTFNVCLAQCVRAMGLVSLKSCSFSRMCCSTDIPDLEETFSRGIISLLTGVAPVRWHDHNVTGSFWIYKVLPKQCFLNPHFHLRKGVLAT